MMNFGLKTLLFQSAPVCTRSLFWAEAKWELTPLQLSFLSASLQNSTSEKMARGGGGGVSIFNRRK
jgi:hypothetical protein